MEIKIAIFKVFVSLERKISISNDELVELFSNEIVVGFLETHIHKKKQ
jgi:hypothetical protein